MKKLLISFVLVCSSVVQAKDFSLKSSIKKIDTTVADLIPNAVYHQVDTTINDAIADAERPLKKDLADLNKDLAKVRADFGKKLAEAQAQFKKDLANVDALQKELNKMFADFQKAVVTSIDADPCAKKINNAVHKANQELLNKLIDVINRVYLKPLSLEPLVPLVVY